MLTMENKIFTVDNANKQKRIVESMLACSGKRVEMIFGGKYTIELHHLDFKNISLL